MHNMWKFSIRKSKILILSITTFGIITSLSCAFAGYTIENRGNYFVDIDPIEVNVEDNIQKLIKYNNCNFLTTKDDVILTDDFSVNFAFDNYLYQLAINGSLSNKDLQELYLNMGLQAVVTFENSSLFTYIKDNVGKSFIDFSYSGESSNILKIESNNIEYTANSTPCFNYGTTSLTFNIAINQTHANSYFYLYNLAEINSLAQLNGSFNFNMNFHFDIIDEYYGYCLNDSYSTFSSFGKVTIDISCLNYAG